jgi:hypothetical protein
MIGATQTETHWAVLCPRHGRVFLTRAEYNAQMAAAHLGWICPLDGLPAPWDDENYDKHSED